jgi:hypothetical protein
MNLPRIPNPEKELTIETLTVNEKSEQQVDKLRRTIVQDDIENIQKRLSEMLLAVLVLL